MILESVEHGPLIWPTIEENGLPSDVYSLVNHHRVAKDLWERIQLLMQGTSLTKQERKCKLYDAFDKFAHIKIDSGPAVPVFKQGDDTIDAINKIMSCLSTVVTSCFPTTNNQLRNSSNPRQQATFHDGRVTVQPLQGRSNSYAAVTSRTKVNISGTRRNNSGQQRVVKCFNCQGEGYMARQCPKPKRKRDAIWFRDKVLLVEAQGSGKVLNEEELAFLADLGVTEAKAVLMANLSSYGSNVLSKVPHSENTNNDMINQSVQEIPYSEQTYLVNYLENEITSNSNIIPYSLVNKDNLIANESLSAELERYKERVKLLEERQNVDLSTREKLIMDDTIREKNAQFVNFEKEINSLKQTLFEQLKEKELLTETFNALGFQNPFYLKKAQQIRPMLYDGSVIAKETNVISIVDSEETLMLEEESRSKMLLKQSDPMVLEKKVNIKPINYAELNRLSKDFSKRFVPQQELSNEQALWLLAIHPNTDQSASLPVKIKAPRELPKVILVNTSLKKLKYHLGEFDTVVKKQTTPNALTEGEWGFEHTKAVFQNEIIPFLKTLKDIFNVFDKDLLNKVTEVQIVFNQMEGAVQQYFVDKQCFEIQKK
ncbi:retrovirus-related pol polyprotein from transposon TNT 1-94 [Tanacetum coccineum]